MRTMTTARDPHTLGWAAYGLLRYLDDRDQEQPLKRADLLTSHEKAEAVRKLVQRLEAEGVLRIDQEPTAFGQGGVFKYRTYK